QPFDVKLNGTLTGVELSLAAPLLAVLRGVLSSRERYADIADLQLGTTELAQPVQQGDDRHFSAVTLGGQNKVIGHRQFHFDDVIAGAGNLNFQLITEQGREFFQVLQRFAQCVTAQKQVL